jgi:hypothetical protein
MFVFFNVGGMVVFFAEVSKVVKPGEVLMKVGEFEIFVHWKDSD